MSEKCTCEPDWDDCYCGYAKDRKKLEGVVKSTNPHYCHTCVDDGVLVELVKKPTHEGYHREYYCSRCADRIGAGYYGVRKASSGLFKADAVTRLQKVRRRAKLVVKRASEALKQLGKG